MYVYDFQNHDLRWLESIEHKLDAWNTHDSKHVINLRVKIHMRLKLSIVHKPVFFCIGAVPPSNLLLPFFVS